MTAGTRYAIAGSGNIGSALARLFGRARVEVRIANTGGPSTIRELAASVLPVSLAEALACDVIFLAIPFPAVEQFGKELPGARVVKAFNQLPAQVLAAPVPAAQGRRVVFISSDFPESSAHIAQLTETLGLSPVQLGRIGEGGRLIQAPNALVLRNFTEQPLS